jgi:hypothetical protein
MSKHTSGCLFIQVVCTDMYARHQKFRLGRLPVLVEKDQYGNVLPGTEHIGYPPEKHRNPPVPAQRCPKCGRTLPGAARHSVEGGAWNRLVRQWLNKAPQAVRPCGRHLRPGLFLVAASDQRSHPRGEDRAATGYACISGWEDSLLTIRTLLSVNRIEPRTQSFNREFFDLLITWPPQVSSMSDG